MESAIPTPLVCPRSQARRSGEEYVPPYPAWVARAGSDVRQVVMGYFGVQWRAPASREQAQRLLHEIEGSFTADASDGPRHFDRAYCLDNAGYHTLIATAYWLDVASYRRWSGSPEVSGWWDSDQRLRDGVGFFREIILPPLERFETLFSTPTSLEGIGVALGSRSASDIQEHAYWGAMRDRIPLSQTDPLHSKGKLTANAGVGSRVRVSAHENIAVIRSGQDWTATKGRERALYLADMEPTLRAGMRFLQEHGPEIGCYSNRYLQHVDAAGNTLEKSFGLSAWRSLGDMESWAEKHPTHLAIFGTFMRIVQELEFKLDLSLYHEVSVLASDQQEYEYINCHATTGMLQQL